MNSRLLTVRVEDERHKEYFYHKPSLEPESFYRYISTSSFCEREVVEMLEREDKVLLTRKKMVNPHIILHGEGKMEIYLPVEQKYISRIMKGEKIFDVLKDFATSLNLPYRKIEKMIKENIELANEVLNENRKLVEKIEDRGIDKNRLAALMALYFIQLDATLGVD